MTPYSQNFKDWKNTRLGTSNQTFGEVGCFVVALSCLADNLPTETNISFIRNDVYRNGCLIGDPQKAADVLGLTYDGKIPATIAPKFVCIAETHYFKPVVPQHFFVWLGDGRIIDPIDGKIKPTYPVASFRLFKPKNVTTNKMTTQEVIDGFDRFIAGKATTADLLNWTPREYTGLVIQLTQPIENGKPSERFNLINAICKKIIGRDATDEEQKQFELQRWSIPQIVRWALNK
ncbi:MAG: hypothetical protein NUV78_03155 [Candidatus Zambryskibacteria bacterium]|nr:hypothetical protein [Candidatus Zambryskibacteria bacterium]